MGLFDSIGSFLFGNESEAAALNQANVDKALSLLGNVPISQLFGKAQGALTGRSLAEMQRGYDQAIARLGTAGTGAQLQTLAGERRAKGQARQTLAQRGLYNSSLLGPTMSGIQGETDRTLGAIESSTAAGQAGLMANKAGATGQLGFAQESAMADLFGAQAAMLLNQAQSQAGVLGNVQHQGSPGFLGGLLQAGGAGLAGGLGKAAAKQGGVLPGLAAGLGGCCWIFLAAHGEPLDPIVRRYRDEHMTTRGRRGYYRLAKRLVPRMRSRPVRAAVVLGMTRPLTWYGRWVYGESRSGWIAAPIAWGWFTLFAALGLLGPVLRTNGETV